MKLPIFSERRETPTICSACKGSCCKSSPGIFAPEDFGAPDRETMRAQISAALAGGQFAIDWWEGDPRGTRTYDDEEDALNAPGGGWLSCVEYIRPAERGHVGELRHASWGGRCAFHGENGCALEYASRPRQCRALEPVIPMYGCHERGEGGAIITKRDYAVAWIPYQDVLAEAQEDARAVANGLSTHAASGAVHALDAASIVDELRKVVYEQDAQEIARLPWHRVRELRVSREDHSAIERDVAAAHDSLRGTVRVVADPYLRRGECIPLDARGNVIELPKRPHAAPGAGASDGA